MWFVERDLEGADAARCHGGDDPWHRPGRQPPRDRDHATFGQTSRDRGARRTAMATLAAPLGDRVVLDLQQGTPVPVVLAP